MLKSLRFSDLVVLAMALLGIGTAVRLMGITDPKVTVVLSMGWTCPALRRLIAWRRGIQIERRLSFDDPSGAAVVLLFGVAPWVLLPVAHQVRPEMLMGAVTFPISVKCLGGLMTIVGILEPLLPKRGGQASSGPLSLYEGLGLFIVSGSVLIALLAVGASLALLTLRSAARGPYKVPCGLGLWSGEQRIVSI